MNILNLKKNEEYYYYWRLFLFISFVALVIGATDIVYAASDSDPFGHRICKLVIIMSGNTAKAVCVVAIFFLGVGVFLGKINWGTATMTVIGIIVVTKAGDIYVFIAGSDASQCATS